MSDPKLGDKVLTGSGNYEPVYSFGRLDPETTKQEFLDLTAGTTTFVLTRDHMVILKGGSYVPSSIIRIGDELLKANGVPDAVRSIQTVRRQGLFAPFTTSGTIIVNGIHASSFISF